MDLQETLTELAELEETLRSTAAGALAEALTTVWLVSEQRAGGRPPSWVLSAIVLAAGYLAAACSATGQPAVVDSQRTGSRSGDTVVVTLPRTDGPSNTTSNTSATTSVVPSETTGGGPVSRSVSAGDPRYPSLGSADIDVGHYDVELTYQPDEQRLLGVMTATVTTVASTDQVALDADGLDVDSVLVDGEPAPFDIGERELITSLPGPVPVGTTITVAVTYSVDLDSDISFGDQAGVFVTNGGLWSVNEPDGASTWIPTNDHPTDKASWTFSITVPDGLTGVANGALASSSATSAGQVTWVWEQTEPMASYLIVLLVGEYELVDAGTSPSGVEIRHAAIDGSTDSLGRYTDVTLQQLAYFEGLFGPYPFDRYGLAITDSMPGLAMETQGLSLFSRSNLDGSLGFLQHLLMAHELAHQWFGDAVSPATWHDIWLNEGFARYAEWLWLDHVGLGSVGQAAASALSSLPADAGPVGRPDELFGPISYDGGAVVLHALRRTIGDEAFFEGLRHWVVTHLDGAATTADFAAAMEEVSGVDLDEFFDVWVDAEQRPDRFPAVSISA